MVVVVPVVVAVIDAPVVVVVVGAVSSVARFWEAEAIVCQVHARSAGMKIVAVVVIVVAVVV
mgnify:CR=1 FL=1